MKIIMILLLLLVPSSVFAEFSFDISCKNVTKILIVRIDDQSLGLHSSHGFAHLMAFFLNPEAKREFRNIVDASQQLNIHRDAMGGHSRETLIITANGKPLQNDVPEIHVHGSAKVGTIIIREQDAFDTARSVCPDVPIELIAPPKVPTHGLRE